MDELTKQAGGVSTRGFIALARGVLGHPVVGAGKSFSDFEAWVWLLFEAAYVPRRICVTNGRTRGVLQLVRGQLSHSRSYMAKAWGWSEKRVRTFLYRLESDGQIVRQSGHLQTVITICNYELYQNSPVPRGEQTGHQSGRHWAVNGPEEEQSNKVTIEGQPSDREQERSKYAFENGVIKLTQRGLDEWIEAFEHLNLRAELLALTPWANQQGKNWFFAVSGALAKRNREQAGGSNARAHRVARQSLNALRGLSDA